MCLILYQSCSPDLRNTDIIVGTMSWSLDRIKSPWHRWSKPKRKLLEWDVRAIVTGGLWPLDLPSVFVKCCKVPHTLGYTITNSQSSSVSCVLVSHMYKVSAVSLVVPQSHRSRMSTTVLPPMKDKSSSFLETRARLNYIHYLGSIKAGNRWQMGKSSKGKRASCSFALVSQ